MRALLALLALAGLTASALAQATVSFNNNVSFRTKGDRLVRNLDGSLLVGSHFAAQLYYGASPDNLVSLTNAPARFRAPTTSAPGTWSGGTRTLPGFLAGDTAWLQVRVWDSVLFPDYDAAVAGGGIRSASCPFTYTVPGGVSPPPSAFWMWNFRSTVPLDGCGETGGFTFRRSGNSFELSYCHANVWQSGSLTGPGELVTNLTVRIPMTNDMMFFRVELLWFPR